MTTPNILILMVDQLNGTLFPNGPAEWLHAPNLKKLAARSVRFQNCYTASPLCAPGRASFMSGQLPSVTGVYDNAAEFPSSLPTYAHHLRRAGYQTSLSGKMHFVGPDQLHGFEERLTTDIYPPDFGWTPDYRKPHDPRPWCLTVSFTHPHDPYVARKKYWDLYEDCDYLLPDIPAMEYDAHDPHSKRIFDANDWRNFDITEDDIKRSRRAYFANISYLDDKIGEILETLETTRQEAVILFVSDHGDMLGERGLWFKMSFYEGSSRVPMMMSASGVEPRLVTDPVSNIDVCPTLCDIAGISMQDVAPWTQGETLLPLARGRTRTTPVAMEYAAEASYAPMVSLRSGPYKFNRCALDPDQLFDLENDPHELVNLVDSPEFGDIRDEFSALADAKWDLARFDEEVRRSQARRWIVYEALRNGEYYPWDYQPLKNASERFMRNHMDLNVLEENQRFPRCE